MGVHITRILYNDLIMPFAIEMQSYTDANKMEAARRVQVILGIASDFITGTLLLYLFYNSAMHQIAKRVKIRRHMKKMSTGIKENQTNENYLASMGTQTINSLLNKKSFQFDIIEEEKESSPTFTKQRDTEKTKKTVSDYAEVMAY